MATVKLPMTIKRLKQSLDSDKLRKYGVHANMICDHTDTEGTIEVKWEHKDFIFMKMVIAATRERITGDVHDTLVFDLQKVLGVTVSGMGGTKDANIVGLQVSDIKEQLQSMLEVWNNIHLRLHSITNRSPNNNPSKKRAYLAIAQ